MRYFHIIFLFFLILPMYSCVEYPNSTKSNKKEKLYYSSKGFALIYDKNLFINKVINKQINNEELHTMHNTLKSNVKVKIINPSNLKYLETKITKQANYPNIFNIVITKEIASILELDLNNPYVEIMEVKKNRTFIAKESNTFEEEKKVADKVPVDEVKMDDLSTSKITLNNNDTQNKKFILVISDFYYLESANKLKIKLAEKINHNIISIKKISSNKYRLMAGPFKNFNALKVLYISLNELGFENLNVYKE